MSGDYSLAVLVSHRCVTLRMMGESKTEPAPRYRVREAREAGLEGHSETLSFAMGLLALLLWLHTMGTEASTALRTLALLSWSGSGDLLDPVVSASGVLAQVLGGWVLVAGGLLLATTRWRGRHHRTHAVNGVSHRAYARRDRVAAGIATLGILLAALLCVGYVWPAWRSLLEANEENLRLWGTEGGSRIAFIFALTFLCAGTAEALWRRRWLLGAMRMSRAQARREWRQNGGASSRWRRRRHAAQSDALRDANDAELWLVHASDQSAVLVRIAQWRGIERPPRVVARAERNEASRRRGWAERPGVREVYDDVFVEGTRGIYLGERLPKDLLLRVASWRGYDGRDES